MSDRRIAVLADQHLPFLDHRADAVARKLLAAFDPNCIWLAGDLLDLAPLSHFKDADRYKHKLQHELDLGEAYLASLRKAHAKADIVFQPGNHEHRMPSYIIKNARKLADLRCLDLREALRVKEHRVTVVEGRRHTAGGTFVIKHGTRYGEYAIKA